MELDGKYSKDRSLKCDCLLFDLDDTLYPFNSSIAADIKKNIQDYMVHKLGVEETISLDLCVLLYKQYGTTMAGLRAVGYQFDYDDYHRYTFLCKFQSHNSRYTSPATIVPTRLHLHIPQVAASCVAPSSSPLALPDSQNVVGPQRRDLPDPEIPTSSSSTAHPI